LVEAAEGTSGVLLVLTNCPDEQTAARIRRELVEAQLAACVNQLGPVQSTYRWQGAIEEASEIPLLIKTTRERYLALEARIRQLHPYSVPEIVAIPVERGCLDYLSWVDAETRTGLRQTE
jgi:periplasmic divalent cation tolerance protein